MRAGCSARYPEDGQGHRTDDAEWDSLVAQPGTKTPRYFQRRLIDASVERERPPRDLRILTKPEATCCIQRSQQRNPPVLTRVPERWLPDSQCSHSEQHNPYS